MATITKTFKETDAYPTAAKSTWTVSISMSDITVTGNTFNMPSCSLKMKYSTYSGKAYVDTHIMQGIKASSMSSSIDLTFNGSLAGNTNKILKSVSVTHDTGQVFNNSNPTVKKVPITLFNGSCSLISMKNKNGDSPIGSYAGNFFTTGTLAYITLNAPPTFSCPTQVTFQNTPIYTRYTTASITLSNISAKYGGYITKVEFTIGSQTATETFSANSQPTNNEVTLQLSPLNVSGTDLTPIVKVTDSRGQVTTKNLTKVTINPYVITATNLKIGRINASDFTLNDEGTSAVLQATFNYSSFTGSTLIAPTVTLNNESISPTWYTSWNDENGFSGEVGNDTSWSSIADGTTLYAKIVGPLSINEIHPFTIKPKTTLLEGVTTNITLPQAFYLLVGRPGGHGLGIGMKPLGDNLYIRLPAYMIKDDSDSSNINAITIQNGSSNVLTVDWSGNTSIRGTLTVGTATTPKATTHHGAVVVDSVTSGVPIQVNNSTASTNTYIRVTRTDKNPTVGVSMGINADGTNHGLYSNRFAKWIIYADVNGVIKDGSGTAVANKSMFAHGHETYSSIATNSYADKSVSFGKTFASAPNVVACLSTSGTAGNIGNVSVSVFDITTTGCTVRVFNNRGSALSPAIEWIAVGI